MISDITSKFIINNSNISYSSNGTRITNGWAGNLYKNPLSEPVSIEYEITDIASSDCAYMNIWKSTDISDGNNQYIASHTVNNANSVLVEVRGTTITTASVSSKTGVYRLDCYSDRIEFYKDDSLLATATGEVVNGGYWAITSGGATSRYVTVRNLKIKPL